MFNLLKNNHKIKIHSIMIKKILITLIFLIMTTAIFAQNNNGVLRLTVGTMLCSSIDSTDFQPVPLGDALLFKVNYSTMPYSGIGFTGGIQIGVIGVFHDAGSYNYPTGIITDSIGYDTYYTPTSGFSIGGEAGAYFKIGNMFGVYPVLNLNLVFVTLENTSAYSTSMFDGMPAPQFFVIGALVGFDIFIIESMPITLELGLVGGAFEFLTENYDDRIGFTAAIGIGYAF